MKALSGSVAFGVAPSWIPLSAMVEITTSGKEGSVTVTGTFATLPFPLAGSNSAILTS